MSDGSIRISSTVQKWRYRCPEGHTNWFPIDGKFRCRSCAKNRNAGADVDPEFEHLHDQETGEQLSRADVVLATGHKATP